MRRGQGNRHFQISKAIFMEMRTTSNCWTSRAARWHVEPSQMRRLPQSLIRSSQPCRFASPAASIIPSRVSRTGGMPAKLRTFRSSPRTPCALGSTIGSSAPAYPPDDEPPQAAPWKAVLAVFKGDPRERHFSLHLGSDLDPDDPPRLNLKSHDLLGRRSKNIMEREVRNGHSLCTTVRPEGLSHGQRCRGILEIRSGGVSARVPENQRCKGCQILFRGWSTSRRFA